jgi:BASS family bile acid:Na+ symporter
MEELDQVRLNFSPTTLNALNIIIGLIMFGVALDLKLADFKIALSRPRAFLIGVVCQFLLLPAMAFLMAKLVAPSPSIALGMLMVAACPGGNISNFTTNFAKGSTALSVCMTAVSTTAAIFMTPFNVTFWGGLDPETAAVIDGFALDPFDVFLTVMIVLGIPLGLGLFTSEKFPNLAAKLRKPFKVGSLVFFFALVVIAFASNFEHFLSFIGIIFLPVAALNAAAFALGYGASRLFKLSQKESRAVAIEIGIQNSGLGLVLTFAHFDALGGMAAVAAWWGIWHIISGLSLGYYWSRREPDVGKSGSNDGEPPADATPDVAPA